MGAQAGSGEPLEPLEPLPAGKHFRRGPADVADGDRGEKDDRAERDAAAEGGAQSEKDAPSASGARAEKDAIAETAPDAAAVVPVPLATPGRGKDQDPDPDAWTDKPDAEWPSLSEVPHHGRRHSRKRARRRRRLKVAGVVLLVMAVVAGGVALLVRHLVTEGERSLREASQPEEIQTADEAETEDEGVTVEYQGTTYRYNENVVSIVVMGYDRREDVSVTGEAGQADAIMVVTLDTQTGEMRVIGIPRDTMVDVDENVGDAFVGQEKMQIALAFSYGDGYETSAENVVRAVSRVLYGMPMNYYVALSMDGIGALNDAVGGITLTSLATIPNTPIVEGQEITLFGTNAVRYVQYRDISQLDSSLQRQARQSQYLKAFFSQAISSAAGNPSVLVSLYRTALDYATTNLGVDEFSYLATVLLQNGMSQLDVTTLQGEAVKGAQYVEYNLDQESVYQTVLDVYYTPVEDDEDDAAAETADGDAGETTADASSSGTSSD